MEQSTVLAAIEQQIAEGNTEAALQQLLSLLETQPEWAEFAQTIRIQQADLFEIKSQVLRGTISADNERTALNQVRDKALRIVQRVRVGKVTMEDPAKARQPWRYYAAGGVVTLAIVFFAWNLLNGKKTACPTFGKGVTTRVMILPFKKTDGSNLTRPEFNLSDALNDLISRDNSLAQKAEADINEAYDIEKNYPSPSEAATIGKQCDVEIVVWGKTSDLKDTVEVRYRVVRPTAMASALDTTNIPDYLADLKDISMEGVLRSDVKTIARMLYTVVALRQGPSDMALQMLGSLVTTPAAQGAIATSDPAFGIDTTTLLFKAEGYLLVAAKRDSAANLFNEVLAAYPDNYRALRGRGLAHLKGNDVVAAVQDLHQAQPDPSKADPMLLRARTDAYLKSGWPEMARRDLEQIKRDSTTNKKWIRDRERQVKDSIKIYEVRLENARLAAQKVPQKNEAAKIDIAKANIALGKPDEAVRYSEAVNLTNPKNIKAVETTLEAYTQKGDKQKVQETIEKAERRGVNTKSVKFRPGAVGALKVE
jgi:tetratricopeptide (TPR) repeat protein